MRRKDASAAPAERTIGWGQRLHWLALAFAPSSLLLAVTAYITTDLASVPLLWVVPLSLYLLTFVIVFARRPVLEHAWMVKAQPFIVIPLALVFSQSAAFWLVLPLHLAAFFVTAMVCHGELAKRRPATSHLTEFYLWMAFGGMLGGVFNALLAPIAFDWVLEYPLALVVACLLRPRLAQDRGSLLANLGLPLIVLLLMLLQVQWRRLGLPDLGAVGALALLVPIAMLLYGFAARPLRFGLGVAAVLGVVLLAGEPNQVQARARSFFGVYTIKHDPAGYHFLVHGTTVHGAQHTDPAARREPLTYFHRAGPARPDLRSARGPVRPRRSARSASASARSPATAGRASAGPSSRSTRWSSGSPAIAATSTTCEDCAPEAEVVLGDARRSLQQAAERAVRSHDPGRVQLRCDPGASSDPRGACALSRQAGAGRPDRAAHLQPQSRSGAAWWRPCWPMPAWSAASRPRRRRSRRSGPFATPRPGSRSPAARRTSARSPTIRAGGACPPPPAHPWTDDFSNLIGALRWRL